MTKEDGENSEDETFDEFNVSVATLCGPFKRKSRSRHKKNDNDQMTPDDQELQDTEQLSSSPQFELHGEDSQKTAPKSSAGPRVRIVDGRLTLDEQSLETIDPTVNAESLEQVEENHDMRIINSASFMKREKSATWKAEETIKFYEGLRKWGTDFGLIATMFENRSRRQIKLKFNREERINPLKVDQALRCRK